MESFTIELVCSASALLFPDKTLSFLTKFLPEQLNLEGHRQVGVPALSYPSMHWIVTVEKNKFFDRKLKTFEIVEFFLLEPGL